MISKIESRISERPLAWAIGWTLLILALLTIPGRDIPSVGITGIDKPVHAALFFVFTWLWSGVFKLSHIKNILLALALALTFGIVSELYQSVLPFERIADPYDVLADWIGATVAAILLAFKK